MSASLSSDMSLRSLYMSCSLKRDTCNCPSVPDKKRTCHEVDENVSTCTKPEVIDQLQCQVIKYPHHGKMCLLYHRKELHRKKTCHNVMTFCKCHHCCGSSCTKLSNEAALTWGRVVDHAAADILNEAVP